MRSTTICTLHKYCTGDQIKMSWVGHLVCMGERRGVHRVLVDHLEDLVDNIKLDLQEVGWGVWTGLIWLRIDTGGRCL